MSQCDLEEPDLTHIFVFFAKRFIAFHCIFCSWRVGGHHNGFVFMFVCSTKCDSSHGNEQQKQSKEKSKSDLFNVILKQKCRNSCDAEDN